MKKIDIEELLNNGEIVKIGKNQCFKHGDMYVVEKYETTESSSAFRQGEELYSVYNGYYSAKEAIRVTATI